MRNYFIPVRSDITPQKHNEVLVKPKLFQGEDEKTPVNYEWNSWHHDHSPVRHKHSSYDSFPVKQDINLDKHDINQNEKDKHDIDQDNHDIDQDKHHIHQDEHDIDQDKHDIDQAKYGQFSAIQNEPPVNKCDSFYQ